MLPNSREFILRSIGFILTNIPNVPYGPDTVLDAEDIIGEQDKTRSLHFEAYILVKETGEKSWGGGA